jgi:hypothetical protein
MHTGRTGASPLFPLLPLASYPPNALLLSSSFSLLPPPWSEKIPCTTPVVGRDGNDRDRMLRQLQLHVSRTGACDGDGLPDPSDEPVYGEEGFAGDGPDGPEAGELGGMSTFSDSLSASFQVSDLTSPGPASSPFATVALSLEGSHPQFFFIWQPVSSFPGRRSGS